MIFSVRFVDSESQGKGRHQGGRSHENAHQNSENRNQKVSLRTGNQHLRQMGNENL